MLASCSLVFSNCAHCCGTPYYCEVERIRAEIVRIFLVILPRDTLADETLHIEDQAFTVYSYSTCPWARSSTRQTLRVTPPSSMTRATELDHLDQPTLLYEAIATHHGTSARYEVSCAELLGIRHHQCYTLTLALDVASTNAIRKPSQARL